MKKLIAIIVILFFFATSYAQDTKPTKQETMDWIAGKFKNYTYTINYDFVKYENGIITLNQKNGAKTLMTVDLSKITNIVETKSGCTINGLNGLIAYGNGNNDYLSDGVILYRFDEEGNKTPTIISFENERELLPRLKKALSLLINYNISSNTPEKF